MLTYFEITQKSENKSTMEKKIVKQDVLQSRKTHVIMIILNKAVFTFI